MTLHVPRRLALLILGIATGITVVIVTVIVPGRSVAPRPVIKNLSIAPPGAQPIIRSIAARSDASCYPALIGKKVAPTITVTKYNFQHYDYVEVVNVVDGRNVIELSVHCVFSSADLLVATPSGWKDLGQRQM